MRVGATDLCRCGTTSVYPGRADQQPLRTQIYRVGHSGKSHHFPAVPFLGDRGRFDCVL